MVCLDDSDVEDNDAFLVLCATKLGLSASHYYLFNSFGVSVSCTDIPTLAEPVVIFVSKDLNFVVEQSFLQKVNSISYKETQVPSVTPTGQMSMLSRIKLAANDVEVIRVMGRGSFGCAFLIKRDNKEYVMKVIDMVGRESADTDRALQEASVMGTLRHPFIIESTRCNYDEHNLCLCIEMEYADGGTLAAALADVKARITTLSERQVCTWFTMMVLALKHVHANNIIHRDVKTENIFLKHDKAMLIDIKDDTDKFADLVPKLGDFGLARSLESQEALVSTKCGTPYILSPELVDGKKYDYKTDVWSLGIVLYEMMCLSKPFTGDNFGQIIMQIHKCVIPLPPRRYSAELRSLLMQMLEKDPRNRPSCDGILCLPFLKPYIATSQILMNNSRSILETSSS